MSVGEKIMSLMARPNEDLVQKDDVSKWMKYAARGLGTVGGGIAIFLGVWIAVGIAFGDVSDFVGGIWQMLAGFLIIVIEGPCCCMCLDFVGSISVFMDSRPFWHRGALYIAIALPPIYFAPSVSSIVGSGLIFGTGVLYGLMAIGKKASAQEMQSSAAVSDPTAPNSSSSVFKSSLVSNEQPMARDLPNFAV